MQTNLTDLERRVKHSKIFQSPTFFLYIKSPLYISSLEEKPK